MVDLYSGVGTFAVVGLGALALVLLLAFVIRQARVRSPLMPLRLFTSRNFSGANVVQALMLAGFFGFFFLGSLYMQRVLGYDAVHTGLAFLPLTVSIGVLSMGISARAVCWCATSN